MAQLHILIIGLLGTSFGVVACLPQKSRPDIQTGPTVGASTDQNQTGLPGESGNAAVLASALGLSKEEFELGRIYANGWLGEADEIPQSGSWQIKNMAPQSTGTSSGTSSGTSQGTAEAGSSGTQDNPQLVETADEVGFTIKKGTGNGDWNSPQTVAVAKVGKKFTIQNDDTVSHQWHTNGTPCAHGNPIPPGQKESCMPQEKYGGTPTLYDHNTQGKFYFRAE